jgi:mono/diheme cytochrome c family protein
MVKFLAFIGFVAIVIAIVAAGYFFGGFYSVAATAEEPALVKWMLVQVRQASIARHAKGATEPAVNDEAVRSGARAYNTRGCVNCHGAPDVEWAKWSEGLQPDPPDLTKVADERSRSELFWVIKNGINMTGMPSFGKAGASDDEIWTIATFVKRLKTVKPEEYKAWTATP